MATLHLSQHYQCWTVCTWVQPLPRRGLRREHPPLTKHTQQRNFNALNTSHMSHHWDTCTRPQSQPSPYCWDQTLMGGTTATVGQTLTTSQGQKQSSHPRAEATKSLMTRKVGTNLSIPNVSIADPIHVLRLFAVGNRECLGIFGFGFSHLSSNNQNFVHRLQLICPFLH